LFIAGTESVLANATVAIPSGWILPQLSSGKISIRLAELLPLLPQDSLRQPPPIGIDQQTVVLPLAEVVTAISPDALTVTHERSLEVNDDGANQLPGLFDDALLQDLDAEVRPATVEKATPVLEIAPERTTEPLEPVQEQAATPAPADSWKNVEPEVTEAPTDAPENVTVSIRSLVSVLPDHVLACPRAELWARVDGNERVSLPLASILPQLKTARVRVPIETIMAVLPPSLLASPLPNITGETVPLPLEEIIPQIPPQLFTGELRLSQETAVEIDESTIPTPFQEKPVSLDETQPLHLAPKRASEPAAVPEEIESAAQLDDENLAIFAEKCTPAMPPVTEPVGESVPEVPTPEVVTPHAITPEPTVIESVAAEPVTTEPVEAASEPEQPAEIEPAAEETEPIVQDVEATPEPEVTPTAATEPLPVAASAEPISRDAEKFLANLNQCTFEELMRCEGIGPGLAKRITDFRNEHGPFNSLEDLRSVPGIGRKTFRALVGSEPRVLNHLLGVQHNQELTLQEIVRLTSALPGISGCALAMEDGLLLTGQLPEHLDQNTISVFAPQLFKKVGRYTRELRVGQIQRLTVFTDQQPLSIFQAGDIYLVVVHDTRHFSKALLRRCERISQEIARQCRQRAVA
jgi:competence protein ComEA